MARSARRLSPPTVATTADDLRTIYKILQEIASAARRQGAVLVTSAWSAPRIVELPAKEAREALGLAGMVHEGAFALPDPLVPAHVDLRNFPYLPLDCARLRDSRLAATASPEVFRCAVLLWCAAWHQVPAGSLPDDDIELAVLSGLGRIVTRSRRGRVKIDGRHCRDFARIKVESMRHFVMCNDGRWYHPVISKKALEAWNSKEKQRLRTKAATESRMEYRQRNVQRNENRNVHQQNRTEQKKDKEKSTKREKSTAIATPTALSILSQALTTKTAQDVIDHRKALKKPLTPRAAEGLVYAFNAFGDPERAAEAMIVNGWQGFKAEWMSPAANGHAKRAGRSNGLAGYAKLVYEDIEREKLQQETEDGIASANKSID